MDPQTASYYRAVLHTDSTDERPVPESLVRLHMWAVKRNHALGLGGMITKATALAIGLTWLSATEEGRLFSRDHTKLGDMFLAFEADEDEDEDDGEGEDAPFDVPAATDEDWAALKSGADVVVTMKSGVKRPGQFVSRSGGWAEVTVNGAVKNFRVGKVQITGVEASG